MCVRVCRNAVAGLSITVILASIKIVPPRAIASGPPPRNAGRPCPVRSTVDSTLWPASRRGAGPRTARGWRTASSQAPELGLDTSTRNWREAAGRVVRAFGCRDWGMRPRGFAQPARGPRPLGGSHRAPIDSGRRAVDRRRPTAWQIRGQTRGIDKRRAVMTRQLNEAVVIQVGWAALAQPAPSLGVRASIE